MWVIAMFLAIILICVGSLIAIYSTAAPVKRQPAPRFNTGFAMIIFGTVILLACVFTI